MDDFLRAKNVRAEEVLISAVLQYTQHVPASEHDTAARSL